LPKGIIKVDKWLPVIAYGSHYYLTQTFHTGCFDYLKEPWTPEELFLRLERIIIKLNETSSQILQKIRNKSSEKEIYFSYQEMQIIKTLLKQKGNPVNRKVFLQVLWNDKLPLDKSRVIDVHVSNIKKKLKCLNINMNISSIRGIGYSLSE